ncbi:MAG: hypothetical protein ACKN9O_00160 [Actinomycetota bacterium]
MEIYTPSTALNPFGGHFGEGEGIGFEIFLGAFLAGFFLVVFLVVFFAGFFAGFFLAVGEDFGLGVLAALAPVEIRKLLVEQSKRSASALPKI